MAIKKPNAPTPVESVKHNDTRVNIPTEELRNFVKDDEHKPKTVLYPRDPSLDPQLVWKGKDEQDQEDLAVPAVPIYIQEKIHPQALVENLRDTAKKGETEPELSLFNDFNGISDFREKIDFYNHEQHWTNRMILGDSLLVMNSLAEKEGLKGKVQMIYIDPPYGIKFGSNWQVSTRKRDVKDGSAVDATRQPEQIKAFRDTWELGIHSYLAYLRDRLVVARELLTETGSVFVQIGDENVHLVRCLMDEVFGAENFVVEISVQKTGSQTGDFIQSNNDYLLWFAKDKSQARFRRLFQTRRLRGAGGTGYRMVDLPEGSSRNLTEDETSDLSLLPAGSRIWSSYPLTSDGFRETTTVPFAFEGKAYHPGPARHWGVVPDQLARVGSAGRLLTEAGQVRLRRYFDDFPVIPVSSYWDDFGGASDRIYVVQTNARMIERCLLMTTDPGDLVLDPTCGSGTTAYVAEQWGRRWITIDTSRVSLALARTRLMAAKYPYYILSDSSEGVQKEAEITGKIPPDYKTQSDIKKGFVYKRVPHVSLKAIANNEEIDTIHAKWQEQLEPIPADINKVLGKSWEEWEIPRDARRF